MQQGSGSREREESPLHRLHMRRREMLGVRQMESGGGGWWDGVARLVGWSKATGWKGETGWRGGG